MPDGHVGRCELAVGGARWMMSDPFEPAGAAPPIGRLAVFRDPFGHRW